jgi:hypothetical protein
MERNDRWLAAHRDTRKSGCVEAFCTYDTGHDLSPRFWGVPDTCYNEDPARYDPDCPTLPFLSPDLTANVYCQRKYLALISSALGESASVTARWSERAETSLDALIKCCYDSADEFFYDRDRNNRFVRVQSDVLIRVLACELGGGYFTRALERYLLSSRKFFAKYPLTTIALDDPRFSQDYTYNSWAGQTSFLTQLRLPRAFDYNGHVAELTWILSPTLAALARFDGFAASMSPWTGAEGYGERYTPTMLTALDYIERLCGIFPSPDGELHFTAVLPRADDSGGDSARETRYTRRVNGVSFALDVSEFGAVAYTDGARLGEIPPGVRVVTDFEGKLRSIVGLSVRDISGELVWDGAKIPFSVSANEVLRLRHGEFVSVSSPGIVYPSY